jgi:tRNA/tmRNA/rRNA uracil-C5-methylase (TrmA/RlmC/RlmD family)
VIGPELELQVERPVAGGRMLARHNGRIVFVSGAIPGERVRARVERAARGAIFAGVVEVHTASPHRRSLEHDPACGGQCYRHIDPAFQRQLKREIVADAFRRLGKVTLEQPVQVEASPETGYRLRARLHVRNGRAGFFRAGTHDLCDAAATAQLRPETMPVVERILREHPELASHCDEVLVAENVAATERVLHLGTRGGALPRGGPPIALAPDVTGVTTGAAGRIRPLAGTPHVTDTARELFGTAPPVPAGTAWRRHPAAFFQGNRFLTGSLLRHVLDETPGDRVVDLYAGVGLFAVALLARGASVVAVESDRAALEDLRVNTRPWPETATVQAGAVEAVAASLTDSRPDTVIVDPPRTGLSPQALQGVIALDSPRLIYVSCDPPTLARDAATLIAAGYRLQAIRAFDLFPNTAHVETVVELQKSAVGDP